MATKNDYITSNQFFQFLSHQQNVFLENFHFSFKSKFFIFKKGIMYNRTSGKNY